MCHVDTNLGVYFTLSSYSSRIFLSFVLTRTRVPIARLRDKPFSRWHCWPCPTKDPFGILNCHINAAMAVRSSEIIMPIGSVKGNPVICHI